jgi:UDP-N-acetylglucosamine 2-epimerase (non-hydrolysing)
MKVCIAAGTRPEAIKLAPVHRAILDRNGWRSIWIGSGQHGEVKTRALAALGVEADLILEAPGGDDSLGARLGQMICRYDAAFANLRPDLVLVQGDTSTTIAAAMAAFSRQIPVGHVEAGLRTYDLGAPFPEEGWRTLVADIAALHFAPTARAANNLLWEGVAADKIHVTGNTGIDALRLLGEAEPPAFLKAFEGRRLITVTLHRRENWGHALERVAEAIRRLRDRFPDVQFLFVSHANPALAARVRAAFAQERSVAVSDPLDYPEFVAVMRASTLMLSDSGGVQEEAPAFGVPVLVLRDTTERAEAIEAGVARLVGCETAAIVREASRLLSDRDAYEAMAKAVNPFGDGHAAEAIVMLIERWATARGSPLARAALAAKTA